MCLALLGRGDVLWWTVSKDATVDETSSLYTFLSTKPYSPFNEDNWDEPYTEYLAQVVVVNYSGETLATLPVGWATGETNPYSGNPMVDFDPDITLVEIGHPSAGYVGAEWSASKVSHELVEEYLFQVQILQDSSGEENLICFSDFARGADLDYEHIYTEGTLDPPIEIPWTPMKFYTISPVVPSPVPEPTTFLLLLLGFGILALRRKNGNC